MYQPGAMLCLLFAAMLMMLRVEAFCAPVGTSGTQGILTSSSNALIARRTGRDHHRGWHSIAVSRATAQDDETKVADAEEQAETPLDLAKVHNIFIDSLPRSHRSHLNSSHVVLLAFSCRMWISKRQHHQQLRLKRTP
jgi:hypothetical protein